VTPAEKLALAQRFYAAFSPLDIGAIIPLFHPECGWRMAPGRAVFGTDAYRGHAGLREFVSAIDEGAESYAAEIDQAKIRSDGALLLRNTTQARSRGTHIELSSKGWQEIEFRDGLILSVAQFGEPPPGWDDATPIT
jgi:SnoaL-like domain